MLADGSRISILFIQHITDENEAEMVKAGSDTDSLKADTITDNMGGVIAEGDGEDIPDEE